MIGVYKITNKINGKVYIGQSENIDRRWKEHRRHYKRVNSDKIILYTAFKKYGLDNFTFEVLKECKISELAELEINYIVEYNSCVYFKNYNGYNMTTGGETNAHLIGEMNGMSVMTEEEVYEIREKYNNKETKECAYESYSYKIPIATFADIWTGKTWKHIHYDVYTVENKSFHKGYYDRYKKRKHLQKLSDIEILKIRDLQNDGVSKREVFCLLNNKVNNSTFNDIWYGKTFINIQSIKGNKRIKYSRTTR